MRNIILLFILIVALFIGCNDEQSTEIVGRKYTGITKTGPDGPDPLGSIDPDDWYYKPDSMHIYNIFKVLPAYPNPTNSSSTLTFALTKNTYVKVWMDNPMVNKETLIIEKYLAAGSHSISVKLLVGDNNDELIEGIIRVFFECDSLKTYPLIHGDIEISNNVPQ